jgi:xanthine permease XanP
MKKPADLVYGVEERPPFFDAIILALQHVLAIAVNLVYPLLLAREAGLSTEAAADMLRIGMVALAVGTVLQALPRGPVGCHYLPPMVYASPYLAPGGGPFGGARAVAMAQRMINQCSRTAA